MNLCLTCQFQKKELPCHHPIVPGLLPEGVFIEPGLALGRAYAEIRKALELQFEWKSWKVNHCNGYQLTLTEGGKDDVAIHGEVRSI